VAATERCVSESKTDISLDAADGFGSHLSKKNLSRPNTEAKKYPYLLKGIVANKVHQVWATDITYIPMKKGFMYLVAIINLYSRKVLAWSLSNTLEVNFCIQVLQEAIDKYGSLIFSILIKVVNFTSRFAFPEMGRVGH
jgi:transposase InsO family protein